MHSSSKILTTYQRSSEPGCEANSTKPRFGGYSDFPAQVEVPNAQSWSEAGGDNWWILIAYSWWRRRAEVDVLDAQNLRGTRLGRRWRWRQRVEGANTESIPRQPASHAHKPRRQPQFWQYPSEVSGQHRIIYNSHQQLILRDSRPKHNPQHADDSRSSPRRSCLFEKIEKQNPWVCCQCGIGGDHWGLPTPLCIETICIGIEEWRDGWRFQGTWEVGTWKCCVVNRAAREPQLAK